MPDPAFHDAPPPVATPFRVGVDGGGTGTRARLQDAAGRTLGEGRAGPSGLSQGVVQAWRHVEMAIARAFAEAGMALPAPREIALGLGLAGATVAAQRAAFLRLDPGYALCVLAGDGQTQLLGAHAGRPGLVVAAGTGSVAMAMDHRGQLHTCGGWGYPSGDEGSGAWLGLRGMALVQQAMDGRRAASPLSQSVLAHTGGDAAALQAWCIAAGQAEWARLAPLVFDAASAGDEDAAALLDEAASALARLAHGLDERAGQPLPVVLCGSVGERLGERWPSALRARRVAPVGDSCDGALRLLSQHGATAATGSAPLRPAAAPGAWRIEGHVLTPVGYRRGSLHVEGGRIAQVLGRPVSEDEVRSERSLPVLLPGFIDLHVHGGGGADTMDAGDAVRTLARLHARHGTTALLATTMTAPLAEVEAALRGLAPEIDRRSAGAARVLGVHLEGPYISPGKLGAQPDCARAPSLPEIAALHALAPIRVLTLAPEVPDMLALIPALVGMGIRVQLGHTSATYEQALDALAAGASGFTHLFNAMSPLHHRAPGVVGAALAMGRQAELIPDLLHVHPGAIRAALRAIPGLFCVTDATAAAGMPEGAYRLGRQTVHKCLGAVRLADGTLAGSALTMDQALRHLVEIGLTLADASARVSTHAAIYLGIGQQRGGLQPGAVADIVALDPESLQLRSVWVEGEAIELAHAH